MITDCYFARGKTHNVCQDYTIDAIDECMVVLSDGCSSSAFTDWGARLLCRSALKDWNDNGDIIQHHVAMRADYMRLGLDMIPDCLDATVMVAFVEIDVVKVKVWGDGVVAARRRDTGRWELITISYTHNAPAYLSYTLSESRMSTYLAQTEARRTVTEHREPDEDGNYLSSSEELTGYPHGGDGWAFPIETYDMVVLLSDGVESFQRKEGRTLVSVPVFEVIETLLDIRGTEGLFMTRAAKWFLNKFCPANDWHHNDDLSVAALYLGER